MRDRAIRDCSLAIDAIVQQVYGDGEVGLKAESTCAGCAGTCLWKSSEQAPVRFSASGLKPGDRVRVYLPTRFALLAAVVAYGLPLTGLLGGALSTSLVSASDPVVLIGAVAGCAAAFAATRGWRARLERTVIGHFAVEPVVGVDRC